MPKIKAKIERGFQDQYSKIEKTEFIDITKDGIPEFYITSLQGRSIMTEIFYLSGSGYELVCIEQLGNVSDRITGSSLGRAVGLGSSYFLSNGDLCRYGYGYVLGTNESQFT